jgi:pilus assembly protein TadC
MLIDIILLLIPIVTCSLYVYTNREVLEAIKNAMRPTATAVDRKSADSSLAIAISPVRLMLSAGFKPGKIANTYILIKVVSAIAAAYVYVELSAVPQWSAAVALFFVGFFIADAVMYLLAGSRKDHIERSLCFFIDHVASLLTCGLSLERSLTLSLEHALPPANPLRLEFKQAYREIDNGKPRDMAFTELANRANVSELKTMVIVLNTSFRTGASVVDTMLKHADIIRLRQQERSIRRINKKTVTAMFPLVLANFPMFLLIVFFAPMVEMSKMFPKFNFW